MLTLNSPGPNGTVTTNFEHAEKLIEIGAELPAAAMISGMGDIGGKLVSELLRSASDKIDHAPVTNEQIQQAIFDSINPLYVAHADLLKRHHAAIYSVPPALTQVNQGRAARGLPPIDSVDPSRVIIRGDPAAPNDPLGWDVVFDLPLTVVIAAYLRGPWAASLEWPGPRINHTVASSPLSWWGSGGASVSRLVLGFDMSLLSANSAVDAQAEQVLNYAQTNSMRYAMPTPVGAMPLQDAVNFTEYLGQVAIGYDKFTSGSPGVGGPLEVMILRPGARTWVQKKQIHSSLR